MEKKKRIPITDNIAAEVLFISDRTCCVCNMIGKEIQIHHIDENPSNNSVDNLAVLCFEHHNDTMIKGGFGRKLNSAQIIKYRNDWVERVKNRRIEADKIASIKSVTGSNIRLNQNSEKALDLESNVHDDPEIFLDYLERIIIIQDAQEEVADIKFQSGITLKMIQACSELIDFYEGVLFELSRFYPLGHFDKKNPKNYFNEKISSLSKWHRLILTSESIESSGTLLGSNIGMNVVDDMKNMVVDIVEALTFKYDIEDDFEIEEWIDIWLH